MPPISVMIKPASGSCNMQCTYCFYCDEQEKRSRRSYGMMSEATLKNSIRKSVLHAEGSCFLVFQGGEPSLAGLDFFKKAVEYAVHYNRRGIEIHFAFQTNGTNQTEEWCEFFREHHFLVGSLWTEPGKYMINTGNSGRESLLMRKSWMPAECWKNIR